MSFAALGLSAEIVRAVSERGYTEPTPIQAQAIPVVLSGRDLMGGAQTGTGKTAGFTLPILQLLTASAKPVTGKAPIRALVLIPTRELAAQVEESVREYGKYLSLKSMTMIGGVNINPQIRQLNGLLTNPALIEVARRNQTAELIEQRVYPVDRERKRALLTQLIKDHNWFQVLVFTRTKHGANNLAEYLNKDGISAMAIHGNKSQAARTRALAEFKTGKLQVLCATDIAARGIDISELPHVVNYELPNVPEDYVHRIGRTGRAGSNGEASSLVCIDEKKLLNDIERLIKREIPVVQIPGFEPDPRIKAEPILNGQNRGGGGQRQGQGRGQPRAGGGQARTGGPRTGAGGAKPAAGAGRGAAPALHRTGGRGR